MDTLKSLFVVLFITLNSLCHALTINCSVCKGKFEYKSVGSSRTVCKDCKELIAAVKAWKQGCKECRMYVFLDLCPDCLKTIKQEDTCNNRHHTLFNICTTCLEIACKKNAKYDNETTPNCLMSGCTNPISSKGCCGYPTGLCSDHNDDLKDAIKKHKEICDECKTYPHLDICPTCLDKANKKNRHTDCPWSKILYEVYIPCKTCVESL